MRERTEGPVLVCRAIAGTYVVILAWDFLARQDDKKTGLMGFALERTEHGVDGGVVERYWLRGIKRFRNKDEGLEPGSLVPTADHPVQGFLWGDYTAKAGVTYSYRVVPTYGKPKLLQLDEESATTVKITTEPESVEAAEGDTKPRHDIYFNRGVIGSQAYARKFKNSAPDPDDPDSEEMKWLSRGLYEGLRKFIKRGGRDGYGLRAAVYEFKYQPIVNAFAAAIEAGGDVQIVYDGESDYKVENLEAIRRAGLEKATTPRTVSEGIRHNKFIVLLKGKKPIAVWTGSTNISAGGIFGHSNVGHIVWDRDTAEAYLDYWERLAENLTPRKLVEPNQEASPTPDGKPSKNSIIPLFSPRDKRDSIETLQWYADRIAEATEVVCFTVAFNLDEVFQKVFGVENDVLRYIVKDDDLGDGEIIGHDRDVIFAAGAYFGSHALQNFRTERDNPLNSNNYIHTKFLLIDPLGDDPTVVTGSANFSRPSQRINDENMLVIRGDTRVADVYFGEYMRVFDHHYARYIVRKLRNADRADQDAGYLKEKTSEWLPAHFNQESYKAKRRKYFVG
jgi:hypothetical protein